MLYIVFFKRSLFTFGSATNKFGITLMGMCSNNATTFSQEISIEKYIEKNIVSI